MFSWGPYFVSAIMTLDHWWPLAAARYCGTARQDVAANASRCIAVVIWPDGQVERWRDGAKVAA